MSRPLHVQAAGVTTAWDGGEAAPEPPAPQPVPAALGLVAIATLAALGVRALVRRAGQKVVKGSRGERFRVGRAG